MGRPERGEQVLGERQSDRGPHVPAWGYVPAPPSQGYRKLRHREPKQCANIIQLRSSTAETRTQAPYLLELDI